MNELPLLVSHVVKLALVALLVGMALRGRLAVSWAFTLYVVACLVGNSLATLAPQRFFNSSFWMLKQGVYDVLKVAVALELAWRTFAAFPGAWRTARTVLLGLVAVSTLSLAWLTPRSYGTLWEWQSGAVTASVWLLTATALLVVFYQVPIGEWERAIMLGLAPYLLVFVTWLSLLERHGWAVRRELSLLDQLAFLGVVLFWTAAAWRRAPGPSRALAGAA